MHDDAAMQNFHFVSSFQPVCFFRLSSRIMNKNSVHGGAFLSNFSCAYAGRHEGQPGEIASHLPALVGAPGAESK